MGVSAFFQWRIRGVQQELLANDQELLANDRQISASHARLGEHLSSMGQMVGPELREMRAQLDRHITSDLLSPTDPPVNPEAVPPPHPTPRHDRSPAPTSQEQREGTP
jgi:hypothetical protein